MSDFECQRLVQRLLFGTIMLSKSHLTQQLVVVKHCDLTQRQHVQRWLQEQPHAMQALNDPFVEAQVAERLQQLKTPMIDRLVQYHAAFQDAEHVYFVMAYCPQGDLYDCLQQVPNHRLPSALALVYFQQIVEAVVVLHQDAGFAHRDLSLENVLLDGDQCKLADFGVCVPVDQWCHERAGKQQYMAPEMLVDSGYDPTKADIWSLGIVLFVLVTGAPLCEVAASSDRVFVAISRRQLPQILQVWGFGDLIPLPVIDLLQSMLEIDPQRRPSATKLLTMTSACRHNTETCE